MFSRPLFLCATTGFLFAATSAAATERASAAPRLTGEAAVGVAALPKYEGSEKTRLLPLMNGRLALGERYLALEGVTLRANVVDNAGLEAGPVVSLNFGRSEPVGNSRPILLGKIDDAVELGLFVAASIPVRDSDRVRFSIQGVNDVSNVHRGYVVTGSASYTTSVGQRGYVASEISTSYASGDYADTYFSAGPANKRYTAKSGLKDVGASLTAGYRFSEQWGLIAFGSYKRLIGDAGKSPVVRINGDRDQISWGLGATRSF